MLNFKKFLANAATFLNGSNDNDPLGQLKLPLVNVDIPTISTAQPVQIFKVARKGKSYEICAENNISWYCPASQYIHLMQIGKAPQIGDKVTIDFYKDGSVKSYAIVSRNEKGLAD
mgnify:CR=1 FL=1